MASPPVTERDLRLPEFRDSNPDDLEFRPDGKIVRKDRWEVGMRHIAEILGFDAREGFEIEDVIRGVRELTLIKSVQPIVGVIHPDDIIKVTYTTKGSI